MENLTFTFDELNQEFRNASKEIYTFAENRVLAEIGIEYAGKLDIDDIGIRILYDFFDRLHIICTVTYFDGEWSWVVEHRGGNLEGIGGADSRVEAERAMFMSAIETYDGILKERELNTTI